MTYTTAYAPVQTQAQAYAPVINYAPVQAAPVAKPVVKQPKPLTIEQIVFTIVNSEIARMKREKLAFDAKSVRLVYQQHYANWTREQLMQAAFHLVLIHDKTINQWRLVANEAELRQKQIQFSKNFFYAKKRFANRA